MFLLVTGASCVGKSTARRYVEKALGDDNVTCVELKDVVEIPAPEHLTVEWRQGAVAETVELALELQSDGRDVLFCGDPVPPDEVFSAPRSEALDGGAVLLLYATPEAQTKRLTQRGEDLAFLSHHLTFMEVLRKHVNDPELHSDHPGWTFSELDTSTLEPTEVGERVLAWIRHERARQR